VGAEKKKIDVLGMRKMDSVPKNQSDYWGGEVFRKREVRETGKKNRFSDDRKGGKRTGRGGGTILEEKRRPNRRVSAKPDLTWTRLIRRV